MRGLKLMGKIFNFFKRLFSKKENKPVEPKLPVETPVETPKPIEIPSVETYQLNKKVAILVGHGAGDSGAMCFNGMAEHEYNKRVSQILQAKFPSLQVYFKSSVGGWAPVYAKLSMFRPDLSIELHLNAYNGKAFGCEVLITSEKARSLGELFSSRFCNQFGRTKRGTKGIKWLSSGDRGFGNVYSASKCSKVALLVEPFFCDNQNEYLSIEEYSEFLIQYIVEFDRL
jgi:N-acetylmuramoyl-L-alanine amidase